MSDIHGQKCLRRRQLPYEADRRGTSTQPCGRVLGSSCNQGLYGGHYSQLMGGGGAEPRHYSRLTGIKATEPPASELPGPRAAHLLETSTRRAGGGTNIKTKLAFPS